MATEDTQVVEVTWVDINNKTSKTKIQFLDSTSVADIQTALTSLIPKMAALSACGVTGVQLLKPMTFTATTATSGVPTGTVEDKVEFFYIDYNGGKFRFTIPGPLQAGGTGGGIFQSDERTLNRSNSIVSSLLAAIIADLYSPYGEVITAIAEAVRWFRNRKQKNS